MLPPSRLQIAIPSWLSLVESVLVSAEALRLVCLGKVDPQDRSRAGAGDRAPCAFYCVFGPGKDWSEAEAHHWSAYVDRLNVCWAFFEVNHTSASVRYYSMSVMGGVVRGNFTLTTDQTQ